jgi:bacterial DNA-binding protein
MELQANERITTKDFAKEYAEKNDISIAKANEIVSNFLNTLKDVIKSGKSIQLYGIGNIDVYTVPAGEVRNPLTQEFVTKPERNKVKFKFSQAFKKEVE